MKKVGEMTDLEIAEKLMWIAAEFDSDSGDEYDTDVLSWLSEAKRRLSTHSAQRIADLSGCVVTKDGNGLWFVWAIKVPFKDISMAKTEAEWVTDWEKHYNPYTEIKLPTDNRPWQESIYRPQVNVKNGGTNDE